MYAQAPDLKDFYASMRGRVVQRLLRQKIQAFWPNLRGQRLLGVGYTAPFLRPYAVDAERVVALMPARQGAVFWSAHEGGEAAAKSSVALCAEESWPIETSTVDRVLIVHGIHDFDELEAMLQESWRVLTGQGRLMLVVPNRSGIWARIDNSPFGQGAPYSMGQMRQALRDNLFVPEQQARALFVPPTKSRLVLAAAPLFEKIGARFFNAFGGVNIIEASKQVYAGHLVATSSRGPLVARRRIVVSPRKGEV